MDLSIFTFVFAPSSTCSFKFIEHHDRLKVVYKPEEETTRAKFSLVCVISKMMLSLSIYLQNTFPSSYSTYYVCYRKLHKILDCEEYLCKNNKHNNNNTSVLRGFNTHVQQFFLKFPSLSLFLSPCYHLILDDGFSQVIGVGISHMFFLYMCMYSVRGT